MSISQSENILFNTGKISFDGLVREVSLAAVPEAQVGQYVLVHVGMALSVIDEDEAMKTLEYFKELSELEAELGDESEES